MAAYRWLKEHGIPFERQVEIEIQPGFVHNGKKHRPILYRADFRLAKCSEQNTPKCSEQKGAKCSEQNVEKSASENPSEHPSEKMAKCSEQNTPKCSEQKGVKCSEQNDWLWVDMKGFETAEFKLKRKLLLFKGYEITCVKSVAELIVRLQESKTRTNFR